MGRVEGKVAFITGAARGQGRAHAIRLAQEGASIVAVDFDTPIDTVAYPMATSDDLVKTVEMVEAVGGQIVAAKADVRDQSSLDAAVARGIDRFGFIDIVCANAGIVSYGPTWELTEQQWQDVIDIDLTGAWHTVKATVPTMITADRAGSIILTSSTAALSATPNISAYAASKHGLVGLMRTLALELGPHRIRVNTVHPTTVMTNMILNDATYRLFCPDLEAPTQEQFLARLTEQSVVAPWVEADDISNAVLWLSSDEARNVTSMMLPVTGGNEWRR